MIGRLRTLLRDESGVALVFAVVFTGVLLVIATTALYYGRSNQQHASYQEAEQTAFALAEDGLARAKGELYTSGPTTSASAVNTTNLNTPDGKIKFWGVFDSATMTWTLFGEGQVRNPSGAADIRRTVSSQTKIAAGADPGVWSWLYHDNPTTCMTVANNAIIAAPLYVRGNLCMSNNSRFTGSQLQVEGTVSTGTTAAIGYLNAPIDVAKLKGGCTVAKGSPRPCSSADRVYAKSISQTTDGFTKPPIDLAYWYANASPGPRNPCTTASSPPTFDNDTTLNTSVSTIFLTPSSYTCKTPGGELTWVAGNPGRLTVSGTIFFDGNLYVTGNSLYSGKGSIYASGTVSFSNGARLCAVAACDAAWSPSNAVVVFVAGSCAMWSGGSCSMRNSTGMQLENNVVYQGGAYVVTSYKLMNNATNWGPVIADQILIENNADQIIRFTADSMPPGVPAFYGQTLYEVPGSYRG